MLNRTCVCVCVCVCSLALSQTAGVKRIGNKELKEGNIDVSTKSSPYISKHLTYSPEDFQRLVDLTFYNTVNNKETIINVLKNALNNKTKLASMTSADGTNKCRVN